MTTTRPITISGKYEHTDGSVGLYGWRDGAPALMRQWPSWAEAPSREDEEAQIDRGAREYTDAQSARAERDLAEQSHR